MKLSWISCLMLVLLTAFAGCGGSKQSSLEGKLVDWNGKPVAGVKIIASQVQPMKGYEQVEAVSREDGSFRLDGLFPSAAYVLKPWSDKWTSETEEQVTSGTAGETTVLPDPVVISHAYAKDGGSLVLDLATGTTRFTVSGEGVIRDAATGLEWLVGPDSNTSYAQAEEWVAACQVAGGGWRMPSLAELKSLFLQGVGERNMDPSFKTTGLYIWSEPNDPSTAWRLSFSNGHEYWPKRENSVLARVFAVRGR